MSFNDLVKMVEQYAQRYSCSIADSIDDLEFDGPEGSFGPSQEDRDALLAHFEICR